MGNDRDGKEGVLKLRKTEIDGEERGGQGGRSRRSRAEKCKVEREREGEETRQARKESGGKNGKRSMSYGRSNKYNNRNGTQR